MKIIPERIIPEKHLHSCSELCPYFDEFSSIHMYCNKLDETFYYDDDFINGFPLECPLDDKEEINES